MAAGKKKQFVAPEVRRVRLEPKEAVLAGCKLTSWTYTDSGGFGGLLVCTDVTPTCQEVGS